VEAKKAFAEFERLARSQIGEPDNANPELIFYYAEHARQPAEALRIARLEVESRHDVRTLDAYAWALYVNGYSAEARRQIEKVLAVGTRNAALFYHAGTIEAASGNKSAGIHYLKQSLDLNPTADVAEAARHALTKSGGFMALRSSQ
jgi:tetratricopeptide (TPR) repeat protein